MGEKFHVYLISILCSIISTKDRFGCKVFSEYFKNTIVFWKTIVSNTLKCLALVKFAVL